MNFVCRRRRRHYDWKERERVIFQQLVWRNMKQAPTYRLYQPTYL